VRDWFDTYLMREISITATISASLPVLHIKEFAAPETKAAAERARLLIEQAEALGEPPEDPLFLHRS
jgi:hypothetical protein